MAQQQNRAKVDLEEGDNSSGDDAGGINAANKGTKRKESSDQTAEESKRAERRAANRRSAFQSRQRRKILIEDLQKTVATLSKENTDLRNSSNQLRAKLETAMLENQLLRKQQGGEASTVADGGGAGPTDSRGVEPAATTKTHPAAAPVGDTGSKTAANTFATRSAPSVEGAPTPSPAMLGASQGVPPTYLGVNNSARGVPPSQILGASQGPSAATQLLAAANQGVSSQLLNGLGSLGSVGATGAGDAGASSDTNHLLAARLALASGGLAGINNVGSARPMVDTGQQQQNSTVQSLASNPGGSAASLSLESGQLQQLAMLLGGSSGRPGPSEQGQQHLALLQAALGRSGSTPNDSISQVMRALSETQPDQTTGAPKT